MKLLLYYVLGGETCEDPPGQKRASSLATPPKRESAEGQDLVARRRS